MQKYLIKNIQVVNEGHIKTADVLITNGRIEKIAANIDTVANEINGEGKYLFPGCIDDQVHFREPGLTHKATIYTEAKAAVAGGVTSYMEMPNTIPNALTQELLENKYNIASQHSVANYSFFMGTGNDNAEEVLKTNDMKKDVCGIKIFMGSSTGNMLVDNPNTLDKIFRESEVLIATHCEDEKIIRQNLEKIKSTGKILTAADHPIIRDEEACYESSLYAIQIAKKYNTRLHILHISTEKELQLFTNMFPLKDKRITAEVCVHHLHFTSDDYAALGNQIKCNPAIKAPQNKEALWKALLDDRLDVIATDHAPHTWQEKNESYEKAHAGLPLVQHSLSLMLYYYKQGKISLEKIAEKMSHAVSDCFQIKNRGYIREGYHADLVIVDPNQSTKVTKENILYKCGWSPLEKFDFPASITHTFVNGHLVYKNGIWDESQQGQRLKFDR
ncbi:MAG: dihydroorotase [Chitinophagaceae bacterium]|jgi:dihydroorotase|nr:dihydroorotase [Chitinophagaceae bacterium]MBK9463843.1 dihydroorotase [Chitinophagaceae bacterium]MBK9659043.1 dihydroorotase [Chitinophagaceae bacterium]MBP6231723.1 dihydroorotase [Chitinophagaceae bacterium]MBP6415832.1 dihydroorotase [Chitinophagaceae bacterium]